MTDTPRPEPVPAGPPPASPPPATTPPASPPPAGGSRPPGIPERRYAGPPRSPSPVAGPSRWERLVASWRIALRLGRRDVVRHKGRSALIVIMVALPVALLVAGNLLYSTQDLPAVEKLDYSLGRAQARITPTGSKVTPTPYFDMGFFGGEATAKAIPGWGTDAASQREALARLTGGTVVEIGQSGLEVRIGKKMTGISVLGIDAAAHPQILPGIARLDSGRWATTDTEVVVTRAGVYKGLPESGTFSANTYGTNGERVAKTFTVVGVGEGYLADYGVIAADLIGLPPAAGSNGTDRPNGSFLVDRATAVSWAEVVNWADYGIQTISRSVVLDPPDPSTLNLPDGLVQSYQQQGFAQMLVATLSAIALLLETTLLVGPAFAVSAARSRRTLALAASNGATGAQLRRTVLGQAVVLGALSALVGGALGFAAALGILAWLQVYRPDTMVGPLDIPGGPIALVVGCAVLASLIAALIPARGLARLDIVAVMRGQSVSPPARFRMPVAGLILAGAGAVGVFWSTAQTPRWNDQLMLVVVPVVAMLSAVLLVVGTLLLVPMVLVGVARLGRSAPVAVRMALRDAARQRGRATSTVAAILAGMSVLAAVLVTMQSVAVFAGRQYVPQRPEGQGLVVPYIDPSAGPSAERSETRVAPAITSVVQRVDPGLTTATVRIVETMGDGADVKQEAAPQGPFLVALRQGCTPLDALTATPFGPDMTQVKPCASLMGSSFIGGFGRSTMVVGTPEVLTTRYGLDAAAAAVLAAGGLVVSDGKGHEPKCTALTDPGEPTGGYQCSGNFVGQVDVVDGMVTLATGTASLDGPKLIGEPTIRKVPALAVNDKLLNANVGSEQTFPMNNGVGALLTPATAASLGAATRVVVVEVTDPRGPISTEVEDKLRQAIDEEQLGHAYVERGFQAYPWILVAALIGTVGLIILVATLVSTALSTAETQAFMGTFAAVGATRRTRRNLAAAQAASLGVVGALLGTVVGLVPGIALSRVATGYAYGGAMATFDAEGPERLDPTIVIPWLQLAIPVLGIPAVAAALAWISIRRAPHVTRRMT